jgi:hypothetical protein
MNRPREKRGPARRKSEGAEAEKTRSPSVARLDDEARRVRDDNSRSRCPQGRGGGRTGVNKRALFREQRIDALGHVEEALAEVRRAMDVEPSCGPLLVAAYRALSVLGELRETIDSLPIVEKETP